MASFITFIFISSSCLADQSADLLTRAIQQKVHESQTWKALLHSKNGKQTVFDSNFILSSPNFSLKAELEKTIRLLFGSERSEKAVCDFPARYLWLSQQLRVPPIGLDRCLAFNEFKLRAPLQNANLIYASENLVSPSSMMGHIFLNIQGINKEGYELSHSLSFFTAVDDLNVPKLLFESLLLGKEGYFALNPYREKEQVYLSEEQRNIWSYHLDFSAWQKELLQAHLWELKDTKLTYFFHDYNCATFTLYALAVADPRFLDFISSIDSPIDVAKAAKQLNLIDRTSLTPSNKWKVRMLNDALSETEIELVKHAVSKQDLTPLKNSGENQEIRYLQNELASSYAQFLFEEGRFKDEELKSVLQESNEIAKAFSEPLSIDLSDYKDPLKTQEDSQVYSALVSIEGDEYLQLGFLAAAKRREDDSRQYFGETDLRLFDLAILIPTELNAPIILDDFSLYSVSALMPWDTLTGGISGRFGIGAKTHFNPELKAGNAFDINGGIGFSYQLHQDILAYSTLGAGYGFRAGESYLYTDPEIGAVINEVFNMKTLISYHHIWNQNNEKSAYEKLNVKQSFLSNKNIAFFLGYERIWRKAFVRERFDLSAKYYF